MIKTKPSFLFLTGLSVVTTLSVGLFGVETAQAGCGSLDFTCKDSWIREKGRDIDPTDPNSDTRRILRENDPTSPEFAANQWGNAGGAGYPAAAKWMRANNGNSQGWDEYQNSYLRPHFGSLLDQVAVIYNANLMDDWSAGGYTINVGQGNSAAQTYCNRIYVDDPYKPNDSSQLALLAHELKHSQQCQQLGGEGKFGFHYFREFKRANQNYENNKLEKEAFDFQNYFAGWYQTQSSVDPSCKNNNITMKTSGTNLEFARGTEWITCSGYKFIFQTDANLVLYNPSGQAIWNTGTNQAAPDTFVVQADGNMVLYKSGGIPVWNTGTGNSPSAFLAIQWDGNVVVYDRNEQPIWSTNTAGK